MAQPADPGQLEQIGALKVANVGIANSYILNPDETWKTSQELKTYHLISAQALIGKSESNRFKKRMTHTAAITVVYDRNAYLSEKRRALNAWAAHLMQIVGDNEARSTVVNIVSL